MQDSRVATQSDATALPSVPELERLRIHNLFLRQQLLREQLNRLIETFLQTPQPRALQGKIDELTKDIKSLADNIFASAHLDPNAYRFDLETGQFSRVRSLTR